MSGIRVLVSANVGAAGFARLDAEPGVTVTGAPRGIAIVDPGELTARSADYPEERSDLDVEALLAETEVLVASRLPRDLPERAPRLRWIHVTSAGVDAIWQPYLQSDRYLLTTGKGIHAIGIAEYVLAAMLLVNRSFGRLLAQSRAVRWEKVMGGELHGRTVVILGVGSIGSAIARRAKAFGMAVIGVRRNKDAAPPEGLDAVVGTSDLAASLAGAHFVVNCLPLTPDTNRLIDAHLIGAMSPDTVFINVGRAATVDGAALRAALAQHRIRGAVLDVHDREPLPADDSLWKMEHVIVTPHIAGLTDERDRRGIDIICENLRRYAAGSPLINLFDRATGY
jgi:phosphoglycerate dehydrogenase-like enzyme